MDRGETQRFLIVKITSPVAFSRKIPVAAARILIRFKKENRENGRIKLR
jgi:hypothetical protein